MSSRTSLPSLFGNIAALIAILLGMAFLLDLLLGWLGYAPVAFCYLLRPVISLSHVIGVLICSIAFVMWAASRFKSEGAVALFAGGVAIAVLPKILPHYLGASCIPPLP